MRHLVYSFYGEGATEYDFLRLVIERVLVERYVGTDVDILWDEDEFRLSASQLPDHAAKFREILRRSEGRSLVFVHADSDSQTRDEAFQSRFDEPLKKAREQLSQPLNNTIPVVVVRSTEAWMLADFESLKHMLNLKQPASAFKIPTKPDILEGRNAENLMDTFLGAVNRRRKGEIDFANFCVALGRVVSLPALRRLSAFALFETELEKVLSSIPYLKV